MTTVAEIMDADPVTISPDTDVQTVVETMKANELPGLPVVDADGKCVGIVTESDLIIADEEADLHIPHYIQIMGGIVWLEPLRHFEEKFKKALASDASQMMTSEDLTTIGPESTVGEAGKAIAEHGHNRLPVVDSEGRLVGVVTRVDVLSALTA
jgi:CBS domain-containing protein